MAGQAADRSAIDTAKGGDPRICQASEPCPAKGTKISGARMAEGWERGRQEDQRRASPNGTSKLDRVVCRAGDQPAIRTDRARSASGAQVDARMQRRGEGWISCHDQSEATGAADTREIAPERRAVDSIIVAQDDAGEATRQAARGWTRIRQPVGVGEQPERRNLGMKASSGRMRPGQEARVHLAIAVA